MKLNNKKKEKKIMSKIKVNKIYKHADHGRIMKVVQNRGVVCEAREPKGGTVVVPSSKLRASRVSLATFRELDRSSCA